jgi:ribosome biogenesis protein UTP30
MLQPDQVAKAVRALLKHESNPQSGKKAQLFDEVDHKVMSLVVGMKEFPRKERTKPYPIGIPHTLHGDSEICLIVKDPQKAIKERLEAEPIEGVAKVIGLTKLRNNYKTFEAKRNLCDSYDLFMVDRRILPMLPKLLGNTFFRKKKCAPHVVGPGQ